jgi:hypothetical protein
VSGSETGRHLELCRSFRAEQGTIQVLNFDRPGLPWPQNIDWEAREHGAEELQAELEQLLTFHMNALASGTVRPARYKMMAEAVKAIGKGRRAFVARNRAGLMCGLAAATWPVSGHDSFIHFVGTLGGPRGTGAALVAAVALSVGEQPAGVSLRAMVGSEASSGSVSFFSMLGFVQAQPPEKAIEQNWAGRGMPMCLPRIACQELNSSLRHDLRTWVVEKTAARAARIGPSLAQ